MVSLSWISTFGLSRCLTKRASRLGGTPRWAAPEVFRDTALPSTAADVFSFGNIVYECATGRIPFEKCVHFRIAFLVGMEDKRSEILPEDKVREDVRELIERCWKTDPKERPDFTEIVQTISRFPAKKNFDETKEE